MALSDKAVVDVGGSLSLLFQASSQFDSILFKFLVNQSLYLRCKNRAVHFAVFVHGFGLKKIFVGFRMFTICNSGIVEFA